VYLDDALYERVWVDEEHNTIFVDNITTAFSDKDEVVTPSTNGSNTATTVTPSQPESSSSKESSSNGEEFEDEIIEEEVSGGIAMDVAPPETPAVTPEVVMPLVRPRFDAKTKEALKEHVIKLEKQQIQQHLENPRNIIKLLIATVGYQGLAFDSACTRTQTHKSVAESRTFAAANLDEWLANPTAMRFAKVILCQSR